MASLPTVYVAAQCRRTTESAWCRGVNLAGSTVKLHTHSCSHTFSAGTERAAQEDHEDQFRVPARYHAIHCSGHFPGEQQPDDL